MGISKADIRNPLHYLLINNGASCIIKNVGVEN